MQDNVCSSFLHLNDHHAKKHINAKEGKVLRDIGLQELPQKALANSFYCDRRTYVTHLRHELFVAHA
jgi:hypothetical protein